MLALAQGPTDLLITIAFIAAAIMLIVAKDRVAQALKRQHRPQAATPTGLVRVIRTVDLERGSVGPVIDPPWPTEPIERTV